MSDRRAVFQTRGGQWKADNRAGTIAWHYPPQTTIQKSTSTFTGASSLAVVVPLELPKEPGCHRKRYRKRKASMHSERWSRPKEHHVEFPVPRVSGQNSFTKEQSEAFPAVERSLRASTGPVTYHTALSVSRVLNQKAVVEEPSEKVSATKMVNWSGRASLGDTKILQRKQFTVYVCSRPPRPGQDELLCRHWLHP